MFFSMPLARQEAVSAERSLAEWATANRLWLRGQITPNRVVPDPDPTRRRLLVSYDIPPEKFPQGFHRSATYENALAALVFSIKGESDRAAFTLHALARLVRRDGSLWFSYNTANNWPDENDHDGAILRAGAVGWAGYALAFYLAHEASCAGDRSCVRERAFFLETAERLGSYILSLQVNNPGSPLDGLVRQGYGRVVLVYRPDLRQVLEQYRDEPALGVSTENNISAWFFLRQLAALTSDGRWSHAAERISQGLLRSAWNNALGQFNQGLKPDGTADSVKALDCASWGALFLLAVGEKEKARKSLGVIDAYYPSRDGEAVGYRPYSDEPVFEDPQVGSFFSPENPRKKWRELPLVWSEGTLGVALACLRMGQPDRVRSVIDGLRTLQVEKGGLRYASREVPHQMASAPSVAASAWLILVVEAFNGDPLAGEIWR